LLCNLLARLLLQFLGQKALLVQLLVVL